jgi:phosphohistidine phosphatase SixA
MSLRLGLLLSLALTTGCATRADCPQATTPPQTPSALRTPAEPGLVEGEAAREAEPQDAPVLLLLVRHGEKADDGTPDPPLTDRGRERATCLAALLESFAPTHLFSSSYQRTRATLEPLAKATGLAPTVLDAKDDAGWQRALRELPPGSRAVVVGHSNTVPSLVTMLGGHLSALDAEGNIPHDTYDRLVHVVVHGPGLATSYTTTYCTTP